MIFIYLVFIIILLIGIRFTKNFNSDYLSKETTTTINGMFVITIFFSHFASYLSNMNKFDYYLVTSLSYVGQLMVTSFLFYSGFGIYESIKNKQGYINSFFKKRFIPTFINFSFAVVLFIIVNLILGNNYSVEKILLSFTGYESIGNSNWYMLAIFFLYLFTMLSFSKIIKFKDIYRIIIVFILTIIYIVIIGRLKDSYYVDTLLCFPFGMMYSYFKERINSLVFKHYYIYLIILLIFFLGIYYLNMKIPNIYLYNIVSVLFILLIVFITMKFKVKSKIIYFFGIHTFWIYILQRIPMMLFKDSLNNYVYFILCFTITILLSYIIKKMTDKLWSRLLKKN